jgi:anti-anti-sigma regulatory factor
MARASIDEETLGGRAHLVVVTGELDMASTAGLRRRFEAALSDDTPRLVVDLTAIRRMLEIRGEDALSALGGRHADA